MRGERGKGKRWELYKGEKWEKKGKLCNDA